MKRVLCLCLLLMLAMPTAMATPALSLSNEEILALFLPGHGATLMENFFYKMEPGVPDQMGNPTDVRYRVRESQRFGDQYILVLEGNGQVHMEGYCNLVFGVYDPGQGRLVGEVLAFSADWADYALFFEEGRLSIIYIGGATYTGLEAYYGGCWYFTGESWRMVWPEGGDPQKSADFWDRRKPELSYESPGLVKLNLRVHLPDAEGLADYVWQYESHTDALHSWLLEAQ